MKLKLTLMRKSKLPVSLRSSKDEKRYQLARLAQPTRNLTKEKPLKEWKHWYLLPNMFPYSAAFSIHHMLLPKRVIPRSHLNGAERGELDTILDELESSYDTIMMNFQTKQSIRHHFHIHLLVYKETRKELKI